MKGKLNANQEQKFSLSGEERETGQNKKSFSSVH